MVKNNIYETVIIHVLPVKPLVKQNFPTCTVVNLECFGAQTYIWSLFKEDNGRLFMKAKKK